MIEDRVTADSRPSYPFQGGVVAEPQRSVHDSVGAVCLDVFFDTISKKRHFSRAAHETRVDVDVRCVGKDVDGRLAGSVNWSAWLYFNWGTGGLFPVKPFLTAWKGAEKKRAQTSRFRMIKLPWIPVYLTPAYEERMVISGREVVHTLSPGILLNHLNTHRVRRNRCLLSLFGHPFVWARLGNANAILR